MDQVKILVVDDEQQIVEIIHEMLGGPGFAIFDAFDGAQALEVARRERPDLILLDVLMPEQDGWLVCAKLKAVEPSPKIIILTALAPEESDQFADFVDADEIVHKPFTMEELRGKVAKILGKGPT